MRYLPVSAMIPLLILWVGIDYEARVAVIFIGTFFQQLILIADVSAHVARDLLDVSYTLGAEPPAGRRAGADPGDPARASWTRSGSRWGGRGRTWWSPSWWPPTAGLGYMILNSMRGLFTDRIFVGIMVIGLLGLLTDQGFKYLHRWLLPWSPKTG